MLRGPRAGVAYAVSMYFDDTASPPVSRCSTAMRTVGLDLLEYVF